MAETTSGSAEPRRLRWSVPLADISTNKWLDQQENISRSLQVLIRESIQREGYIDVVNKPIDQLPRRGRPPAAPDEPAETSMPSVAQSVEAPRPAPAAEPTTPARDDNHTEPATLVSEPAKAAAPAPEPTPTPAPKKSAPPAPAPPEPSEPAQASGPMDMDAIFGDRR